MINRYSLADHYVQLVFSQNSPNALAGKQFQIGGAGDNNQPGSFVGSITFARENDGWTTEADATGSWVHNQSLARHGTVTISIRQVSDDILRLMTIMNLYEQDVSSELVGCTISVYNTNEDELMVAKDCYISKMPDQVYGETAANQDWSFVAGRITPGAKNQLAL